MSTVSYVTIPTEMGMQELADTPSKRADKSCMTLNLPGTFLARRPSGDIKYAGKTGPRKGPIILLALSYFVSFSSTARELASTILLFPFTVLMLARLSFTIWWIGRSSLR